MRRAACIIEVAEESEVGYALSIREGAETRLRDGHARELVVVARDPRRALLRVHSLDDVLLEAKVVACGSFPVAELWVSLEPSHEPHSGQATRAHTEQRQSRRQRRGWRRAFSCWAGNTLTNPISFLVAGSVKCAKTPGKGLLTQLQHAASIMQLVLRVL